MAMSPDSPLPGMCSPWGGPQVSATVRIVRQTLPAVDVLLAALSQLQQVRSFAAAARRAAALAGRMLGSLEEVGANEPLYAALHEVREEMKALEADESVDPERMKALQRRLALYVDRLLQKRSGYEH